MKLSGKMKKNKDLKLETDLLLSDQDILFMKKQITRDGHELEDYLDFLEEIEAFKSKKIKAKYYEEVFEL